ASECIAEHFDEPGPIWNERTAFAGDREVAGSSLTATGEEDAAPLEGVGLGVAVESASPIFQSAKHSAHRLGHATQYGLNWFPAIRKGKGELQPIRECCPRVSLFRLGVGVPIGTFPPYYRTGGFADDSRRLRRLAVCRRHDHEPR